MMYQQEEKAGEVEARQGLGGGNCGSSSQYDVSTGRGLRKGGDQVRGLGREMSGVLLRM